MSMRRPLRAWIAGAASVLLALLTGCGSGGAGAPPALGRVTGQVLMPSGEPVPNATIVFDGERGAWATGPDGTFEAFVPVGERELRAELGGVLLLLRAVTVEEAAAVELGEVFVDDRADEDGDRVPDALEVVGWDVFVNESGRDELATRRVTSDPTAIDTDDDGLFDAEELAALTDPRRADTDGDGLRDVDELRVYKSNPADVDTDLDARGPTGLLLPNPSLFDGNEYRLSHTSPVLADTDGDGLTDWEEITGGGLNPLVADLPRISIELNGDPLVKVNLRSTTSTSTTSTQFQLQQDTSSRTKVDAQSMKDTFTNETQIKATASVGGPPLVASANLEAENTARNVFALDWSTSTTKESVARNEASYQTEVVKNTTSVAEDGDFTATFKVRNVSKRSLRVEDLSILAYRLTPGTSSGFTTIDILGPAPTTSGATEVAFPAVTLGPDGEFSFVTKSNKLALDQIEPLVRRPSSLFFEVANYTLYQTDDKGEKVRDYAAIGERILERCGFLTIDFGNGQVDRHLVATNVLRNPDGSGAGLPLTDALTLLGVPFRTSEFFVGRRATGLQTISSLTDEKGNVVASKGSGFNTLSSPSERTGKVEFWLTMATDRAAEPVTREGFEDASGAPLPLPRPASELLLRNGNRIALVFVRDSDGDGLLDNEEALLGANAANPDTDGDGVNDGFEVKVRRTVAFPTVAGEVESPFDYSVTSDPLLADADNDTLDDLAEHAKGTDPNKADTDGDGVRDDLDPVLDRPSGSSVPTADQLLWYPIDRAVASSSQAVGDEASLAPGLRLLAAPRAVASQYPETGAAPGSSGLFDHYDRFDLVRRAAVSYTFDVDEPAYLQGSVSGLPTDGRVTFAAWVKPSNSSDAAVAMVAASSSHFTSDDASTARTGLLLRGGIPCFDAKMQDIAGTTRVVPASPNNVALPTGKWTFLVATVTPPPSGSVKSKVTIWRDDAVKLVEQEITGLVSLPSGVLRVGGELYVQAQSGGRSWVGAVDDVRVFRRGLTSAEIKALYRERNYVPPSGG